MIARREITEILNEVDREYRKPRTTLRKSRYYSKLALIELCGWIEVTIDSIFEKQARRILSSSDLASFQNKLTNIFGFEYSSFRSLLIQLYGRQVTEKIEREIDPTVLQKMKASMKYLKPVRDVSAHTYIRKTAVMDAPSAIMGHFEDLYAGLEAFEVTLRKLNVVVKMRR